MTLLGNGECLRFEYDQLILGQYTYGKWAGHQSPYLGPARQRELLTYNPTDLEYHNFPHAFFSRYGRLPLGDQRRPLASAGQEIYLADLWLRPGDALVLPPKHYPRHSPQVTPAASKTGRPSWTCTATETRRWPAGSGKARTVC